MTPKDKAAELIEKFSRLILDITSVYQCRIEAKGCALITVNEILNDGKMKYCGAGIKDNHYQFWMQVKEALIEKDGTEIDYFSFITQDTFKSIPNIFSKHPTFTVTMTDNKGRKWIESSYKGFGVFGGKDYFELLAEMNGQKTRDEGIAIYHTQSEYLSPNLTESSLWTWRDERPQKCCVHGYFY